MATADTHCWLLLSMACQRLQCVAKEDGLIAMGLVSGLEVSPPHKGVKTDWEHTMGPGCINFLATDGQRKYWSHPVGAKLVSVDRSSKDFEGTGKSASTSLNQIPVVCETAFVPMQDQHFQFSFKDASVRPTAYEIRVPPYDKVETFGANHLRVWRLEASVDGNNWVTVCEHRLEVGDGEETIVKRVGGEFGLLRWRPELGARFDIRQTREAMGEMEAMMPSYGLGVVTLKGDAAKLEGGKVVDTLSSVDWEEEMKAVHPTTAMKKQQAAPGALGGKAADFSYETYYSHFRIVAKDQVALAGFEVYGNLIKRTEENIKVAESYGKKFNI